MKRYLEDQILGDMKEKMVFVGGSRQVGKTFLSQQIAEQFFQKYEYRSWDVVSDQKKIVDLTFSPESELIIFDEVHKYTHWKNHIKGFYDRFRNVYRIIVTGSARLDLYRKGGDSMMGRYHYHRLHPISLAEACGSYAGFDIDRYEDDFRLEFYEPQNQLFRELMEFGGFPESFFKKNKRSLRRWQNERKKRLVHEDIRDLENIHEISLLGILVEILPERVGSLLSINALREDIKVAHQTLAKWINVLESFYYCFRIYPFASTVIKSLRKEPKLFLWDYSEIKEEPVRFENLVASHLLKFVHYLYDSYGLNAKLMYLRDIQKREVDFVVVIENRPVMAIEVKMKKQKISTPLKYFAGKLQIPHVFQIIMEESVDHLDPNNNIRVMSADKFLTALV